MKLIKLSVVLVLFVSCTKDDKTCIARSANGDALYEVNGEGFCEDQISSVNGEYCDCDSDTNSNISSSNVAND